MVGAFALLDGWFDREIRFLEYQPHPQAWRSYQILEHAMITAHRQVRLIAAAADEALQHKANVAAISADRSVERKLLMHVPEATMQLPHLTLPLSEVRSMMRFALKNGLYQLDRLPNGEGFGNTGPDTQGQLDVYQQLECLGLHARRHADWLHHRNQMYHGHEQTLEDISQ